VVPATGKATLTGRVFYFITARKQGWKKFSKCIIFRRRAVGAHIRHPAGTSWSLVTVIGYERRWQHKNRLTIHSSPFYGIAPFIIYNN
jgi:hypothetical protein